MKPGLDKAELSQTTKPTQDLFRHVNGSWLDSTEIPEDKAVFGSFHMLADDSELAVKGNPWKRHPTTHYQVLANKLEISTQSFLDEDRAEKLGATPTC